MWRSKSSKCPSEESLAPNGPEAIGKRNRAGERRSPVSTVWGKPTSLLSAPARRLAGAWLLPTGAGPGARAAARNSGFGHAQAAFTAARTARGERHQNRARQTASALANA
jgi:hypothetical protein